MQSAIKQEKEIYDAGDAEKVGKKASEAKRLEDSRIDGLRQIMQSKNGRCWMWKLLGDCQIFSVVFNGNSRDYFNLGMRNIGMIVMADIQREFPDEYLLMVKEANKHE